MHKPAVQGITIIATLLVILLISIVAISAITIRVTNKNSSIKSSIAAPEAKPSPTPIANYSPPTLKKNEAYTIIFVGDSMIDYLGENFDYLRENLATSYPNSVFGLFNYGYGATNILSINERLTKTTTYRDKTNEAILDRFFDIIIIGSFGHNPLSEYPLEEGLEKQNQTLDQTVLKLVNQKPDSLIVFLAEFGPLPDDYAKTVVDLTPEQRAAWVNERKAYLKNHINYAQNHNIPLINIYEESKIEGEVNPIYISQDYIHPSSTGVIFMSQKIAEFLETFIPK